ncbi:MAG: hypothetical protein HY370_04755 [Proteobacteria bacterium]|nr:hypothetical protein [Pseudomonadota bacterium]
MATEILTGQKRLPFGAAVKRGLCAALLGLGVAGCELADDPLIRGEINSCERLSRQNVYAVRQLYADFEKATGSRIKITDNLGIVTEKEFDFHWGALTGVRDILDTHALAALRMIEYTQSGSFCDTGKESRMMSDYIFLMLEYKLQFEEARMKHPWTIKLRV